MTIADEIERLQTLHAQGALTDAEFTQAKGAVLTRYAVESAVVAHAPQHDQSDALRFEHELARLDREWMIERESYMVTGRYGRRSLPSEASSILMALFIGGFGLFWTISAASMGAPGFFPLFGVLFILFGVGTSIQSFTKAGAYKQAEQAYQRRRADLLAQQDERVDQHYP